MVLEAGVRQEVFPFSTYSKSVLVKLNIDLVWYLKVVCAKTVHLDLLCVSVNSTNLKLDLPCYKTSSGHRRHMITTWPGLFGFPVLICLNTWSCKVTP